MNINSYNNNKTFQKNESEIDTGHWIQNSDIASNLKGQAAIYDNNYRGKRARGVCFHVSLQHNGNLKIGGVGVLPGCQV